MLKGIIHKDNISFRILLKNVRDSKGPVFTDYYSYIIKFLKQLKWFIANCGSAFFFGNKAKASCSPSISSAQYGYLIL